MVSGWRWDERPERLPSWTYLMVAAARGVHEEVVGGERPLAHQNGIS